MPKIAKIVCKPPSDFDRRAIRPLERQRMRPWLMELLNSREVPGFGWYNKRERSFRISWRHAARHGWNMQKDAGLFELWARHTGKYVDGDEPIPKRWKSNFRCALHSLQDVTELKDLGVRKGSNAFRVYKFLDEKKGPKAAKRQQNCEPTRRSQRPARRRYVDSEEESVMSENDDVIIRTIKIKQEYVSEGSEGSVSDCDSLPEPERYADNFQEHMYRDLPVFDKLCGEYEDMSFIKHEPIVIKPEPIKIEPTDEDMFRCFANSSPIPDDSQSTSSSGTWTDNEIVEMLLDVDDPSLNISHVYEGYHPDLWATSIEEEGTFEMVNQGDMEDHTYTTMTSATILSNPAVITEQNVDVTDWALTGLEEVVAFKEEPELDGETP